eukprot:2808823-Pleurochrysis_carterae.AAC.1
MAFRDRREQNGITLSGMKMGTCKKGQQVPAWPPLLTIWIREHWSAEVVSCAYVPCPCILCTDGIVMELHTFANARQIHRQWQLRVLIYADPLGLLPVITNLKPYAGGIGFGGGAVRLHLADILLALSIDEIE